MLSVLITGGTGTIGKRLSALLVDKGYKVTILTRDKGVIQKQQSGVLSYAFWDVSKGEIDKVAIAKTDYIIHLAGAGVAEGRWTEKRKKEIVESRTQSSALLVKALKENTNKVQTVVSASAIGWYGPDTEASLQNGFSEDEKPGNDFLSNTCLVWEQSIEPVTQLGKRLVKLRTGIVLSNQGGAYIEFKKPLKAGIAAILGNGKQMVSWVHADDICRMYIYAIENNELQGVYNAVAPGPVSNESLILEIARRLKGRSFISIHVPAFLLKIALGEMSIEVLKSTTVSSAKIEAAGFKFLYPNIQTAISNLASEK